MVLQPSDERRKSGSHYTPRSLTEPIVHKALEPILKQFGDHPTSQQLLDLKVCDLAMGSGAFLVETCRQLGDELVRAWHYHKALPKIPPDEDEILHARRLIAQRCLYGVDRNPMAVDLAKLSLWLATLAKDHPFTFLDHTLRHGDSLVGLTRRQIEDFHWLPVSDRRFGQQHVEDSLRQATAYRKRILDAGDGIPLAIKRAELAQADGHLDSVRFYGDLVISAFFTGENERSRKAKRDELLDRLLDAIARMDVTTSPHDAVKQLRSGRHPIIPFHWQIEFPEVFSRDNSGFDVIVGNPPFAGRTTLSEASHSSYIEWLQSLHAESHGNADLAAHFFRRAFGLLRSRGTAGLISTNTICQGDTRSSGLRWICTNGGTIYSARKRYKWPGVAAVVVSVVHFINGNIDTQPELDGKPVPTITAYLLSTGGHEQPDQLLSNIGICFQGAVIVGMGFTFDDTDTKGVASPTSVMREIIASEPRYSARIFPYIGGEEILDTPTHEPRRWVMNLSDLTKEGAWRDWPVLMRIAEERVRPQRVKSTSTMSADKKKRAEKWWQFSRSAKDLQDAIAGHSRVLALSRVGQHCACAFLPTGMIYSEACVIFTFDAFAQFCTIQSRVHEFWVRRESSSMKDDLRYTPTDCFQNFPFPAGFEKNELLEKAGRAYYEYRAAFMAQTAEGLTAIYNHFHNPDKLSPEIKKLRELHDSMDRAVLDAYGWKDIQPSCAFLLDYEDDDEDGDADTPSSGRSRKKPWRYRWPDDIRDEVMARLLALNIERAKAEQAMNATPALARKAKRKKSTAKEGEGALWRSQQNG